MKQQILSVVDRVAKRAAQKMSLAKPRGDSFDILEIAFLRAAMEAAEIYERDFITCPTYLLDLDLLSAGLAIAPEGLYLEFGVASGRTISHMATKHPTRTFYGFDSFDGLPEVWRSDYEKGAFAQPMPIVPSNVTLVKGWFNETLPKFLGSHPQPCAFLHIDCDLYSSTKTIFDSLRDRIVTGTVIVFDEYWNYPGWREHEYKAFEELKQTGLTAKPFGIVSGHQQVAFIIANKH